MAGADARDESRHILSNADNGPDDILDYAIVGGGISGLYAGWRLLTAAPAGGTPAKRIDVFETSHRTGGRLLTWYPFPEDTELHAELGGMRFFKEQGLLWGLITRHFVPAGKLKDPIKFYINDPNGNNVWYLRERILKERDFNDPKRVPYRQDAEARYAGPVAIIGNVIASVLAENSREIAEQLHGRTQPKNWEDWDNIKPILRYRGQSLWNMGFWNLLYDLLSPESYAYVTAAFGYSSLTNNWNAAEAMQSVFIDFTTQPDYQTLREGFGYLPYLVRKEFESLHGKVRCRNTVVGVKKSPGGLYELTVKVKDRETPSCVRARRVILAMPRRSLELLTENELWNLDRPVGTSTLREHVKSVVPYPAFKMFLAYGEAWWRAAPISIGAGRSVSDLPIRQTYYFPPEQKPFPPNEPPSVKRALLMASYDDYVSVPFWQTLEAPERHRKEADRALRVASRAAWTGRKLSGVERYAYEVNEALFDESGFHLAPPGMVRYAQQQLRLVHYNRVQPDPIPFDEKTENLPGYFWAAYQDWSHDPYGGGWNFWAPAVDVSHVMQTIRKPFADEHLYIIGEAYSGSQGWVEGALTTTERVLQDKLGLAPPSWQPECYYMGYGDRPPDRGSRSRTR